MKCSKCGLYSYPLQRCKLGKINPLKLSIKQGVDTIRMMGSEYLCCADDECVIKRQKIIDKAIGRQ